MPTLSASQIAGYAAKAGLTGQAVTIATAIALAESDGNTDVTHTNSNGSVDYGVWQINSSHVDLLNSHNWRDPSDNAAMMYSLSNGGTNFKPWSTYTSGAYLAHLGAASVTPDTSVTGGVVTVQDSSYNPFTALQDFATAISNPHNWLRLGMILGGAMMIVTAVHMSTPVPIKIIQKAAAQAAKLQGAAS